MISKINILYQTEVFTPRIRNRKNPLCITLLARLAGRLAGQARPALADVRPVRGDLGEGGCATT